MKRVRRRRPHAHPRQASERGFTLLEAIIVIVVTGILATIVAVFMRAPVDGYLDTVSRSELVDAADTAMRRIARDARTALPNSLRSTSPPSTACFEFIPSLGGGRYRVAQSGDGAGDVLDFAAADASFDVLASSRLPPAGGYSSGHHAVIYNLGIPGADAYNPADANRAAIKGDASSATNITLAAANLFPFDSPGRRFDVIPDFAIVYACAGGALRRSTRALAASPMAACPDAGSGEVLVANVDCAASAFDYSQAVNQRNGLLVIDLALTGSRGGERVALYQEVMLDNAP